MLRFCVWCAKCAKYLAFGTLGRSVVDALICATQTPHPKSKPLPPLTIKNNAIDHQKQPKTHNPFKPMTHNLFQPKPQTLIQQTHDPQQAKPKNDLQAVAAMSHSSFCCHL